MVQVATKRSNRVKILLDGGTFFEGPRWHDGAWWVSDFYAHRVLRVSPEGVAVAVANVPNRPSGLGFLPDNSLLIVSMQDRKILHRHADGALSEYADLAAVTGGYANDMVVDRHGRAYVGNLGFDLFGGGTPAATSLVRVDPDGTVVVVADDLWCPNGTVISADGKTLIVAESFATRLTAFTIEASGDLSERREWAAFGPPPAFDSMDTIMTAAFVPDGCAIDAENHVWVADALAGRACRVAPGGRIVDEVRAPNDFGIFACALGGQDGRTLVLCAAPDFSDVKRAAAREAVLYAHEVSVPHGGGLP